MKHTGAAFLPLLDDTIDVMLQSVDKFMSPLPVFVIMRILHSIVGVLYQIAVEERTEREEQVREAKSAEGSQESKAEKGVEAVRSYFTEHHKRKEAEKDPPKERSMPSSVKIEDFNEEEEMEMEEQVSKNTKKEDSIKTTITRRQREFVRQILEKSRNFVGYSSRELKMLILSILLFFSFLGNIILTNVIYFCTRPDGVEC